MALSVNSNIQALNAYRNLNKTQSAMSSSLEKLSSGLRINRAADDAAGLAISENLKAQIGGLQQASKNAQDGVSLVQTADGALSQTQTILQRLRTLAVASANGSQSDSSRSAINAEASSLKSELTRIAQTSNFNGVNLLDGTLKTAADFQIGYRADDTANGIAGNKISVALDSTGVAQTIAATTLAGASVSGTATAAAGDLVFSTSATAATVAAIVGSASATAVAASYDFRGGATLTLDVSVDGGTTVTLTVSTATTNSAGLVSALNTAFSTASATLAGKATFSAESNGAISLKGTGSASTGYAASLNLGNIAFAASTNVTAGSVGLAAGTDRGEDATKGVFKVNVTVNGVTRDVSLSSSVATLSQLASSLTAAANTAFGSNAVTFSVSGTSLTATSTAQGSTAKVKINSVQAGGADATVYGLVGGTSGRGTDVAATYTSKAGSFDVYGLKLDTIDLSDQTTAAAAIGKIDTAISQVSTSRANLGALQNRFQYTVDNLDTSAENLSSAQSRILDTDMASEMVSFTRSQILSQAGSAMLAQAKNLPSSLLELLKS